MIPGWLLPYRMSRAFGVALACLSGVCATMPSHAQVLMGAPTSLASAGGAVNVRMELDAVGDPVIAYVDQTQGNKLSARRWNGSAWIPLGPDGFTTGSTPFELQLALQSTGQPIVAYPNQADGNKATAMAWNGSTWVSLGGGFSAGEASSLCMRVSAAGLPVVAFRDLANQNKLTVMRWNGTVWTALGGVAVSPGGVSNLAMTLSSTGDPILAFRDETSANKATVMRWNGTAWAFMGVQGFTPLASHSHHIALDAGGVPVFLQTGDSGQGSGFYRWNGSAWLQFTSLDYAQGFQLDGSGQPVALVLRYADLPEVKQWNGATWNGLGNAGCTAGPVGSSSIRLRPDQTPVVAFIQPNVLPNDPVGRPVVMRRVGAEWQGYGQGSPLDPSSASSQGVVAPWGQGIVVAYGDGTQAGKLTVKLWDGSAWTILGQAGISAGAVDHLSITTWPTEVIVAYSDLANGSRTTVMRWNGSAWTSMGSAGFTPVANVKHQLFGSFINDLRMASLESGKLVVRSWNGSTWNYVGDPTNMPLVDVWGAQPALFTIGGSPAIAYSANSNQQLEVRRWNGASWVLYATGIPSGSPSVISAFTVTWPRIHFKTGNYVRFFEDNGSGSLLENQTWVWGASAQGTTLASMSYGEVLMFSDLNGTGFSWTIATSSLGGSSATYGTPGSSASALLPDTPVRYRQWATGSSDGRYYYFTTLVGGRVFVYRLEAIPCLSIRVLLGGAISSNTNPSMRTTLRLSPNFPLTEPYSVLGYTHVTGGGETISPALLTNDANGGLVDWIFLELRSGSTTVATKSCILWSNGLVTDTNGQTVSFPGVYPSYYSLVVRHRNHLGIRTSSALALLGAVTTVNLYALSNGAPTAGSNARMQLPTSGYYALWPGDANGDGVVRYIGATNDRDPILIGVGGTAPNNVLTGQYDRKDINLDGQLKYVGPFNDRDVILTTVGSNTPNNVRVQQGP